MSAKQLMLPANRAFNSNGFSVAGAQAKLYISGTSTPAEFFADPDLTVSLGPTLTANGTGRFAVPAYQDDATPFRLKILDNFGMVLDDLDPYYFGLNSTDCPVGLTQAQADDRYALITDLDDALAAIAAGQADLNRIVSGCGVAYDDNLNFTLSAGTAYIGSSLITVATQTLSLDAADATNPRIDVLYIDDTGTFGVITGDPAAEPSQPSIDTTSQLYLTFVFVPASAVSLSGITTEIIYDEGTEWTGTTSGTGFTVDSTNNPNSGTKDIEVTSVVAGSWVKLVRSSSMSFDGDGNLLLSIRSKGTWSSRRSINLRWRLANVTQGALVTVKHGSFGFDSSNTTTYQLLVIPKTLFTIPAGTSVDEFRITALGTTGSPIGFYVDPIKLQNTGTTTSPGSALLTQDIADARYVKLSALDADGTLAADSDAKVATQKAVKTYVDAQVVTATGTYTDEKAQDAVATMIAAGTNTGLSVSYNDAGNTESIAIDAATAANVKAGTANKVVTPSVLVASAAPQTLTDGATISWDMSLGYNAKVMLGGNRTLTVSNPVLGLTYSLGVIQDGTGSRTMTWPSSFDWGTTGAPTLTTTASKRDRIMLFCTDASTPKFDAFFAGNGFS